MKITVDENESLIFLLGKRVMVFCMNYIYSGTLAEVNGACIKLEDAGIVYETGPFDSEKFKDFQKLPHSIYIQTNSIESFCETNKE